MLGCRVVLQIVGLGLLGFVLHMAGLGVGVVLRIAGMGFVGPALYYDGLGVGVAPQIAVLGVGVVLRMSGLRIGMDFPYPGFGVGVVFHFVVSLNALLGRTLLGSQIAPLDEDSTEPQNLELVLGFHVL